jgi:hypothetical protein
MVRNARPYPYVGLSHDDWWHPDPLDGVATREGAMLTAEQVERFRNDGFVVVTGLWPDELISQAADEAKSLHPATDIKADAESGKRALQLSAMPWLQRGEAAPEAALNHMTIHERTLFAVAQLMGVDAIDLRLSQSHVIAKYGKVIETTEPPTIDGDQDIHVDYGNNTLLVPPRTAGPDAIACLCYYSHVDECGGATHFAQAEPGELTSYSPTNFNPPNFVANTKNSSAASATGPRAPDRVAARYAREKPIRYAPGTCVLYGMNTWHRGTPAALGQVRHTHHHVWRNKTAEWVNWQSLAPRMAGMPVRFLESLSVLQRTVLGFAAPGDEYWTEETVDAVGRRYPGMDMRPYRKSMRN